MRSIAGLIDLSSLQEARDTRRRWRGLVAGLAAWLEQADGIVVNRPGHAADNGAKPLHEAWLRAAGFDVAPTLTSSSGPRLADFAAAGRPSPSRLPASGPTPAS